MNHSWSVSRGKPEAGQRKTRSTRRIAAIAAAGLAIALGVALAPTTAFATGSVGTAASFEDDDGNLAATSLTDWNSFTPPWIGTAPTRTADDTQLGWQIKGFEDWQATTADSGFAGGTKQDANCPSVITAKADNKADIKRAYLAAKTINNHTYLMLAWVRIPQNTTSPSAHIAFEFNKGKVACGSNAPGLVNRVQGDALIVYDFEGGATDNPTINLSRWITSSNPVVPSLGSTTCDISSDNPPCWNTHISLPAGTAEAKVNTTVTVSDSFAPSTETLGINEFGEAGIDLTNANVFPAGVCTSFGTAFAVSRTSGNSGTAQMKDLVGPGPFNLTNCVSTTTTTPKDSTGANIPAGGLSIGSGVVGVKDSADIAVTGGNATPAGSVTFSLCKVDSPNLCTSGGTAVGTKTLSGTSYPQTVVSDTAYVTSAGRYCWRAEYSGDSANGIGGSSDSRASECFTVNPVTPTLSTQASKNVLLGNAVTDTATLSGTATQPATPVINLTGVQGPKAGGTITFKLYGPTSDNTTCGALVYNSSTKSPSEDVTVTGDSTYNSASVTPTAAGNYHWVAVYSGSSPNTNGTDHNTACDDTNENVVVSTVPSSVTTAQNWVPNDTATISASAGGDLKGKATFTLYDNGTCTGTVVYGPVDVAVAGASPQNVSTSNTTAITTPGGTYSWSVGYTSTNPAQDPVQASCHEVSVLSINDNSSP